MGTAQERLYNWYDGALNIFNQISPTAQNVQEYFIADLKPLLEGEDNDDNREALANLIAQGLLLRTELETELQTGRDRLLEYNSCRPNVASRIAQAMSELDEDKILPMFLDRYFEAVGIDYDVQRDDSWVVHPIDAQEVDIEGIESLPFDEDGMTLTFDRHQALAREDMEYMTYEHPLVTSILEMVATGAFGNTQVAMLKSSAMPQGMILIESYFRVEVIAPKHLNLAAYLPQQVLRVFLTERGDDLTKVATSDKIMPLIERLDKVRARQVVKARSALIEQQAYKAKEIAQAQLDEIGTQAMAQFGDHLNKEISRLKRLQVINPNVRDEEIVALQKMLEQGMQAFGSLSVVPDSIRVLVCVKPSH